MLPGPQRGNNTRSRSWGYGSIAPILDARHSGRRTRVSSAFGVIGYQLVVRFEAITTIC